MTQKVTVTCDGCGEALPPGPGAWKQWGKLYLGMTPSDRTLDFCPACKPAVENLISKTEIRIGQILVAAGNAFLEIPPENGEGATNLTTDAMQSGQNE